MIKNTLMSWSSGKDSAWALHLLRQDRNINLKGLLCTVNEKFKRVAMHGVKVKLLHQQAQRLNLPLHILELPFPCSNDAYEQIMSNFMLKIKQDKIDCIAFGDIFLQDIRSYREERMQGTGITPIFPLWNMPTEDLAKKMINSGLKTVTVCVDPKQISASFSGRQFDDMFLSQLPDSADPCGENGEFHSFVYDGPMFTSPINIEIGDTIERDGFIFTDITAS
jgi:uncharacterized protein (TIGR00290 family)